MGESTNKIYASSIIANMNIRNCIILKTEINEKKYNKKKYILPAQGRARVVGVLVAGTALLELPVRVLRRSISNSPSFFHNSSLSFSLFFSLQFTVIK